MCKHLSGFWVFEFFCSEARLVNAGIYSLWRIRQIEPQRLPHMCKHLSGFWVFEFFCSEARLVNAGIYSLWRIRQIEPQRLPHMCKHLSAVFVVLLASEQKKIRNRSPVDSFPLLISPFTSKAYALVCYQSATTSQKYEILYDFLTPEVDTITFCAILI